MNFCCKYSSPDSARGENAVGIGPVLHSGGTTPRPSGAENLAGRGFWKTGCRPFSSLNLSVTDDIMAALAEEMFMKRSYERRETAKLSKSLHGQLDMYGLAAAATTISIAALSSSAQAEVVFTPAHQEIYNPVTIDLNHDGIPDFRLVERNFFFDSAGIVALSNGSNRIMSSGGTRGFVTNLLAGYRVGPNSAKFRPGGTSSQEPGRGKLMLDCQATSVSGVCVGPWDKTQNAYIGFQFLIEGETHYGWARLKVDVKVPDFAFYLTGYAYETIANKPIITGQASGTDDASSEKSGKSSAANLGMLSAGASALSMWRLSLH